MALDRPVCKLPVEHPVKMIETREVDTVLFCEFEDGTILSFLFYTTGGALLRGINSVLIQKPTPSPDDETCQGLLLIDKQYRPYPIYSDQGVDAQTMASYWKSLENHVINMFWQMDAPADSKQDPGESYRKPWTMLHFGVHIQEEIRNLDSKKT